MSMPVWRSRVFPAATVRPVSTSRVFFFGVASDASVLGGMETELPASSKAWTSTSVSFMPCLTGGVGVVPEEPESPLEPPLESLLEFPLESSLGEGEAGLFRGLSGEM